MQIEESQPADRSMRAGLCQTALRNGTLCEVRHPCVTVCYRMGYGILAKAPIRVKTRLSLGHCRVWDFRCRSDCGIESRLFRFEVVDPLFQIGQSMLGSFHRTIFSIQGHGRGN